MSRRFTSGGIVLRSTRQAKQKRDDNKTIGCPAISLTQCTYAAMCQRVDISQTPETNGPYKNF
ncbi:hypothetical protein CCACVL1_19147 [Corchorus capsularis]|uniref:Uncharacterized protein n=1 Tax=Corchorus capsularis TaxID=210143 RepID=A0A1R3HI54_COCAP|nr:hypothetical protein CCACVL1_19147 [Corchorus capsularis]